MSVLDSIKAYFDAGWDVIPYARGEKGPRESNWTTNTYTLESFTDVSNVGLRLSTLVDVDCDTKEASYAALKLLPHTKRVHGRPSKLHSHFFFKPDKPIVTMQFRDTDKSMIVELRGTSKSGVPAQTMIPPSVHPSGEQLRWEVEGDLEVVDSAQLIARVKAVALTAICMRHWPSQGSRHEARLALAGYLLRANASVGGVTTILETITRYTNGDTTDVERAVRDTAAKLASEDDKEVTGGRRLAEIIGADVVKVLNRIVGQEDRAVVDAVVDELNERHFVIRVGRDELVGTDDGHSLVFQSPAAVAFRYENQSVCIGTHKAEEGDTDEPIYSTKFKIWRKHPDRREYRTLTFAPPPLTAHKSDYNLWRGFAVDPAPGNCDLLIDHIRQVVCAGHAAHADYLLDLLAFGVQNPGLQSEIATVLRGPQGAGKGIFVRTYGELFGKHFVHLTKKEQLTGKFNEQLSGKCVVFADEAFFAGDPTISGPLKAVITEPTIQIERKGVDQYTETNCIKLFMATNSEWAVPAEFHERRMFVLDVAAGQMQNHDYFEALRDEIDHGGREAFLAYLLARPVDRKRLRKAPTTEALRSQQDLSLKPELRWWKDCLITGTIGNEPWPEWIASHELHGAYIGWCDMMKITRRATAAELLKRLGPFLEGSIAERKMAPVRDEQWRRIEGRRAQARGWLLPAVAKLRGVFDRERGSRTHWASAECSTPGDDDGKPEDGGGHGDVDIREPLPF